MPPDFLYEWTAGGMFIFILAVTGAIALAMHALFFWAPLRSALATADWPPVAQTLCGTLFVFSVTFLANTVWNTEDRARELVNEEARSLRTIRTYLGAMPDPGATDLGRRLAAYGSAVEAEWPDMADHAARLPAEARLDEVYRAAIRGIADGNVLRPRILSLVEDLSVARQGRLTIAHEQVSNGQWFTVMSMAVLLLAAIAVYFARLARARATALAIVSFAIAIALFVILAHDRPFVGDLAIMPHAIVEAAGAD